MDRTLTSFIAALRNAEVRVSTAETLDALNAVELVGYRDRQLLKNTLSLMLPKTVDEKDAFADTFDRFFAFEDVDGATDAGVAGAERRRSGHWRRWKRRGGWRSGNGREGRRKYRNRRGQQKIEEAGSLVLPRKTNRRKTWGRAKSRRRARRLRNS